MLSCLTCVHSASVLSHVWLSVTPWTARLLCPWDSPGNNTGVSCHFLFQGIFLTQGSNPNLLCLLHQQVDSLPLSCHVVVGSLSCVRLFATPRTTARHASLSFTISKFAQTHVLWIDDAIQPSLPLPPSSPPALSLSQHQGFFQWVGSSHLVAKLLELQLQHQSFQEYSGLISFRIDWLDLLAVQGTLKRLFQHHSLKATILWCSAFFTVPCFSLTSLRRHWLLK